MAEDHYDRWLAEKMWEMIPAFYRHEDGLGENPGVLRSLVEVMARQGARLRRSQDRLWSDQFVETADDWAVPYLAELLATRLVSALNSRGRRIDVAKTIYYRRRSGTLRVLEELASDIAGWESKVVEQFRRLARSQHGLDPAPVEIGGRFRGRFSGTPPGGSADLRRVMSAEATGGPFDEFHYTPDFRRPRGRIGRPGITKLGFHLFRLESYRIERATPGVAVTAPGGVTIHTFDPSGRDIPLFCPAARAERYDDWQSALEWELPLPIRCRVLGHAEYVVTDATIAALRNETALSASDAATLLPVRNARFADEASLTAVLRSLSNAAVYDAAAFPGRYRVLLREALLAETGKHFLYPEYVSVRWAGSGGVPRENISSADLADPGALPSVPARTLALDAERGRFADLGAGGGPESVSYHYGFSGKVGAGPFPRGLLPDADRRYHFDLTGVRTLFDDPADDDGVVEIADNATYDDVRDRLEVGVLTLQAADGRRPFLQLGAAWRLRARAAGDAVLVLDGLWVGSRGAFELRLERDYESVTLRYCTFDPGGFDAAGNPLAPIELVILGHIETLIIENSILASVRVQGSGLVERVELRDSIITGLPAGQAVQLGRSELHLARVSVGGQVDVHRLHATEALLTARVRVEDTQWGCVRFSAFRSGSRLPRPYESHARSEFATTFTSRRFGDPGFYQLSGAADGALSTGAENGSEIGAFSALSNPIKAQGLADKVEEYAPFGLIPAWIAET